MTIQDISFKPVMDEGHDQREEVKPRKEYCRQDSEFKLNKLLAELVETERKYVADLVQVGQIDI